MKKLALYPQGLAEVPVNSVTPLPYDRHCDLCPLGGTVRAPCMPAKLARKRGGVLVIGEKPSKLEETAGESFYGQASSSFVRLLGELYSGPVSYDYAIRCATTLPMRKITEKRHVAPCRTYLAHTLSKAEPERIIVLGTHAALSVLGRSVNASTIRRAYGWIQNELGDPIPVFVLPNLYQAFSNPFAAKDLREDLKWALTATVYPWFLQAVTNLVSTGADARVAAEALKGAAWITYDVETHGVMYESDFRIETITLLGDSAAESYTWTRHAMRNSPRARKILSRILSSKKVKLVGQNVKYDDQSVECDLGVSTPVPHFDTRLGRKLLEPEVDARLETLAEGVGMGGHKLEAKKALDLVRRELNRLAHPKEGLTKTGKVRKIAPPKFDVPASTLGKIALGAKPDTFAYGYLPNKLLYRYNARDVFSTREVCVSQYYRLSEHPTISRAWTHVVKDANWAVRYLEYWGFAVDRKAVENLSQYCEHELALLDTQMRQYTDINPRSPQQLAAFLYDELGLPVQRTTDSGSRSTDEEALEAIKHKHPYVDLLLQSRKLEKFAGTYGRGLMKHIREDGRVHPSILIDGAGTGRLSARGPNIQNIPRAKGSKLGKMARDCFTASSPEHVLIEADYSQLELRIAAMLSGDKEMINDFKNGLDIHSNGARECCEAAWKIPRAKWDKMTPDERDPYRSQIKTTIFGKLYGKTDAGLAREFGVPVSVVVAINQKIWGRYRRLDQFMAECTREARKTGQSWTWWDGARSRVRPIQRIADKEKSVREHYERTAGNTPIQGTASDFATASLAPLVRWIKRNNLPIKVVAVIHDAIILDAHKSVKTRAARKLREVMLSHNSGDVPLNVDMKHGYSFGSMEKYEEEAA